MPTAALAKEKGVVFVVPRFRLGPLGFLPRLLLNDTTSIVNNSTNFEVKIYFLISMYHLSLRRFIGSDNTNSKTSVEIRKGNHFSMFSFYK